VGSAERRGWSGSGTTSRAGHDLGSRETVSNSPATVRITGVPNSDAGALAMGRTACESRCCVTV